MKKNKLNFTDPNHLLIDSNKATIFHLSKKLNSKVRSKRVKVSISSNLPNRQELMSLQTSERFRRYRKDTVNKYRS